MASRPKKSISYASPAVVQAAQILFTLASSDNSQMSIAQLSNDVGISASKAHNILEALQISGLVKRGMEGKGYALGTGILTLSRKVLDDLTPARLAQPMLEALTQTTRCTSVFGLISGDRVYVAAYKEASDNLRVVMRTGHSLPISFGAHGKAIAAFLSQRDYSELMKQPNLYFYGQPENLDKNRLKAEIKKCRKDGFALDCGDVAQGLTVVAAPVFDTNNTPVGVIEIFVLAPAETARRFAPDVVRTANKLSAQMGAKISFAQNTN
jgi:DNA-binding IclR family transcriptional regulator